MKHCLRLFSLLCLSLISLGLLSVALTTNWWSISIEQNLPKENSLIISNDTRISSILVPLIYSRGLLSECIRYRNIHVLVSNFYDFREDFSSKIINETCSNDQFTCRTGVAILRPLTRCIDQRDRCNKIINCEDKSDEIDCHSKDCPEGYIKCLDGQTCFRKDEQTCDGVSNCLDNSDEEYCNEEKCSKNQHVYCPREQRCARRENSYRCDGIVDCADNSDEEFCRECHGDKQTFFCDSKCFMNKYRCDGIVHCSDMSDELKCEDYSRNKNSPENFYHLDRLCEEKRFNPLNIHLIKFDRLHQNLIYYLQLIIFYGFISGFILIILSIISIISSICCRVNYQNLPFYFYGIIILMALLFLCIGLIAFVNIWIWKRGIFTEYERNSSLETMIYQLNPSLTKLEFFGLSFWLACAATLTTLIGLIISCCICFTIGSSRSENKEYEIMHMQNY